MSLHHGRGGHGEGQGQKSRNAAHQSSLNATDAAAQSTQKIKIRSANQEQTWALTLRCSMCAVWHQHGNLTSFIGLTEVFGRPGGNHVSFTTTPTSEWPPQHQHSLTKASIFIPIAVFQPTGSTKYTRLSQVDMLCEREIMLLHQNGSR